MTSFHHDGHVRQAAIERLNLITTGAELPFLLLRLNDWVSNVRDIAYEAVHARLKPEYAPSFIANLPLVARLETAGRVDHQGLILLIDELLQSDACRPALLASLKSDDRFIRRASFALALNSSRTDLPELTRQALSDRDTVVRLWAAQTVSLAFAGGTLEQFLELMKRDRFMPVRREALRSYVRHIAERAPDELHSALLDPNPAMREEARFHLRTIAPMDVAAFYRETLSAGRDVNLYAAIGGLGETGSEVDDLLIVSYASDQTAKIRRAAIKALARLNAKAHIELFLTALTDEAPDVSRQALNAGAGMAAAIAGKKVWSIFASAPNGHIKRNAFLLLQRLPKWDSICYLLQAIRDRDEAVAGMSRMGIQRWLRRFNRSFTLPSGDQAAKIKDALAQCDELIEERTKQEILFSLKTS
jgi:HEAT repeat protein